MAFMCPHLIEQYYVKVSEILFTYKPQIVLMVRYKDVSDGLILRGSLRKEEHEVIIKMKNSKSQVEALLLIIPKRMWGLENFITVLIDHNVNVWLMEELFQAYVRHLVTSIKKQQAEKKCECLQLKDGSYFRRRWIQLLKIFDAWIFNVGTSLGFMSQTLYPINNSLAFINNKLPLPLPRMTSQQLLQLQNSSVDYSDDQSVTVTEVDDDDVFEQGDFNSSPANSQPNQIIGMIPRETIAKPFRAITNGLIITPLKALNMSLTRSVDCLSNLTSTTLQISESTANKCAAAYPLHKITSGTDSEALVSVRANMMSPTFKSHIFPNSLSQFSFNPSSGSLENHALNSSALARISQKYSIGTSNSTKIPLSNGSITSSTTSPTPKVETKPPKSTPVINPGRPSTPTTKSLSSTPIKPSLSQSKPLRSSTTLAQSSPSLLKSSAKPSMSTTPPKTTTVTSKVSVSTPKSSTKSETTEPVPEFFWDDSSVGGEFDIVDIEASPESFLDDGPANTRSVGTNTIFRHSSIQQNNLKSAPTNSTTSKPKSASVSSSLYQRGSSVAPRLSQPGITAKTSPTNKEKHTTASSTLQRSSSSLLNRTSPRLSDPTVKLRTTIPQTKSELSVVNRLSDPTLQSKLSLLGINEKISNLDFTLINQSSPTLCNPEKTPTPEIPQENEIKSISMTERAPIPEIPQENEIKSISMTERTPLPEIPQENETERTPLPEIPQEDDVKSISMPETIKSPESPIFSDSSVLSQTSPQTDGPKDAIAVTEVLINPISVETQKLNDVICTPFDSSVSVESHANVQADETKENPSMESSNSNSSESEKMNGPIITTEIPSPILSLGKFSDEGISMSSSETVNSSNTDSVSSISDDAANDEDSIMKISLSKSSSLPNSKASSPTAPKGIVKRSISSVFDRLSKPKTKPTVQDAKEILPAEKKIVGRKDLTKSSPAKHKKLASAIFKTSESKSTTNSLATDDAKKIVPSKPAPKIVPPRPKFNTSTKIKAPPPPPPLYDRLAPEDYASQQFNIDWLKKWDDAEAEPAT